MSYVNATFDVKSIYLEKSGAMDTGRNWAARRKVYVGIVPKPQAIRRGLDHRSWHGQQDEASSHKINLRSPRSHHHNLLLTTHHQQLTINHVWKRKRRPRRKEVHHFICQGWIAIPRRSYRPLPSSGQIRNSHGSWSTRLPCRCPRVPLC